MELVLVKNQGVPVALSQAVDCGLDLLEKLPEFPDGKTRSKFSVDLLACQRR